jgi:PAP2 superfamily protein
MGSASLDGLTQRVALDTGSRLRRTFAAIAAGFRSHARLHAIAILVYGLAGLQSLWLGHKVDLALVSLVTGTTLIFLFLIVFFWLLFEFLRLWWTDYGGSPAAALKAKLLDDILAPSRVANTVHAFTANGVFFVGFLAIKKAIPLTYPFAWDESFMELDRALHFGRLPHEILAPLLQYPIATFVINFIYNTWFLALIACFFWQGFARTDTALRQQYLLSYLLTWAFGTCVFGTMLSSAGPCFYSFVVAGADPYAPLMAYLRATNEIYPVWAVPTQDILWQSHLAGFGEIEGVSAMPSMHVATTILFFLLAFAAGKRCLGWLLVGFSLAIFLGSVLLGWHYAVDGYLGALIAYACWKLAGRIVRGRVSSRPSSAPR